MLSELQLLIAKEADLQSKIAKIENGDPDALYIDRVVEMRAPKSTERLEQQQEKLETLRRKRDDLTWEIDSGPDGKPPSKAKQKQLDALQREIAALEDTTADRQMELEKSSYKVNMQTVIKASAFDRAMKLEAELNKIHGRIIKLLDSIKGYEMESRRLRLEERKYNLAKQKLSGAFDVDPETAKSSTKWTTRAATRKFEIGSFGGAYGLRVRDARRFFSHEIFLNASGPCRFFQYGGVFSRNKGLGGVKNRETLRRAGDCRFLDVSERRVRQLRDEKVIAEVRPGLYDLIDTNHRYINYLRKRNPEGDETIDYNTERAKLVRAKRKNEEYELQLKENQLHAAEDIEAVMTDMLVNFKSRLMAIPSKLAPVLCKKTDKAEIFALLKDHIDEALMELSDFKTTFGERVKEDEKSDG